MSFPVPTLGAGPEQDPSFSIAASEPACPVLDAFLAQDGITPFPTLFSNTFDLNPWQQQIGDFLLRALETPPAEGRPPGKGWSHQRWNEFYPEVFFKTAQAGSRENGGIRDERQLHRYRVGEFGRGGLYHNTAGIPQTKGTTKGIKIRFHPNMPIQVHKSLWTFDGTLPPKLLMVRSGQSVLMRHYNALPIDPSANRGFGLHTITTHEHNGHTPAESDGFTNDGNIMEHTVPFDGSVDLDGDGQLLDNKGQLPTIAIGERYDIVVDFSKHGIKPGDQLFFVNTQEHNNGKRAGAIIPLEDILSKTYKARMRLGNGLPERWVKGDPAVGIFFQ